VQAAGTTADVGLPPGWFYLFSPSPQNSGVPEAAQPTTLSWLSGDDLPLVREHREHSWELLEHSSPLQDEFLSLF